VAIVAVVFLLVVMFAFGGLGLRRLHLGGVGAIPWSFGLVDDVIRPILNHIRPVDRGIGNAGAFKVGTGRIGVRIISAVGGARDAGFFDVAVANAVVINVFAPVITVTVVAVSRPMVVMVIAIDDDGAFATGEEESGGSEGKKQEGFQG